MSNRDYKKEGTHLSRPKYVPKLKFHSPKELETYKKKVMFWSENGKDENELIKYITENESFHLFACGETMEGKSNTLEIFTEIISDLHEDNLVIDVSGVNFEGVFWAKKHKVYLVYPQLIKPDKKNENPNVTELKLNKKNTWEKIIKRARKYKRKIVLACDDPLENSFLKAEIDLFKALLKRELSHIRKIILLREISFIGYKHGTLKATSSKLAQKAKRNFLKLVRMGRHLNNQVFTDAQRFQDIDNTLGDNVALKLFKRTETFVGNFPKYIQEKIKTLQKWECVLLFRGKIFTSTVAYNDWHKRETDQVEDLGVYPKTVQIETYNKIVENRYIDRVSEYYTNVLNRIVLARRRHLQDSENTELCQFEIADLLAIEPEKIVIKKTLQLSKPRIVYSEIKYRSLDTGHPRIETSQVKKTVSDLALKKIRWDAKKKHYFWLIENDLAKSLGWELPEGEQEIPTIIEMVSPNGASKGAQSLMKKHNIRNVIIPIDTETFFE